MFQFFVMHIEFKLYRLVLHKPHCQHFWTTNLYLEFEFLFGILILRETFLHELIKVKFPDLDISRQHLSNILRDNNITRKRAIFKHFPKTYRGKRNIHEEEY